MEFNYESDIPLFQQVANQIKKGILNHSFPEETQIPSTTEISKSYKINPATVLKGMNLLVDENLVEKRRGIGMFVTKGALEKLKKERVDEFVTKKVGELVKEAQQLGISETELIQLIERGYRR